MNVTVVIDVFRAFTTASYILDRNPKSYALAVRQSMVAELALRYINPLIIGKPEKGMEGPMYHIPNSPSRTLEEGVTGRNIIHRTEAGARGILSAKGADVVLAAGFVNAGATARYITSLASPNVTFLPMGHEGTVPSLEDDLCEKYLGALLRKEKMDLDPYLPKLKEGSGKYFFSEDQRQYPREDFTRCLEVDRFDFAIRAQVEGDYATLIALPADLSKRM